MTNRMAADRFAGPVARALLVLAVLTLVAGPAVMRPSFAADAAQGAQLAAQWCASCHVMPESAKTTAPQGPPSFLDMAQGDKTAAQLRIFLMKPHGAMPPLTLSRAEIADLVAYIETLR